MKTLRITGFEPGFMKVQHSLYLRRVVGLRLALAKTITDGVLAGEAPEFDVPDELADTHARALALFGATVQVLDAGIVCAVPAQDPPIVAILRLDASDLQALRRAADAAGMPYEAYVRDAVRRQVASDDAAQGRRGSFGDDEHGPARMHLVECK